MARFGPLALREIQGRGGKQQFPLGVPKSRKKCYHAIRDGSLQLFYISRFDRPGPQGREIAKYLFSRPFWPRAAPWHLEKFRAENRKTRFPGARGTFGGGNRPPQKFLPKSAQLFDILRLDPPDPQGWEIAKYWVFRPFGLGAAPWHLEKFRAENRKTLFPGARGTFGEKKPDTQKILLKTAQVLSHFAF